MEKSYNQFIDDISADELYCGLLEHGLFFEKLPPIFTCNSFYNYCENITHNFEKKPHQFVYYESMRNINIPRPLAIPNPMAYRNLCQSLKENWSRIQIFFKDKTSNQTYKVSRIHIRKLYNQSALFEMNYNNWRIDGTPEPDLLIGKSYIVSADISNCFPSIYTHSLPWALVGKHEAKNNRNKNEWFNDLDSRVQNTKNGETHGLLIGPHASNLLSEIILTAIDFELCEKGWKYIRNIDDYTCYVNTYEEGQCFLVDLNEQLRKYDLALNHKKTKINALPVASEENWITDINSLNFISENVMINYRQASSYLNTAIKLMQTHDKNAAILNYAIKKISKLNLTENAKKYCIKTILHYAYIYPYLLPLLDEFVLTPFNAGQSIIMSFSNQMYKEALKMKNYEAISYSLYFAIKYDFIIDQYTANKAIDTQDCIVLLLSHLYFKHHQNNSEVNTLKSHAKNLIKTDNDFEPYWIFIYEILPKSSLKGEWKAMKSSGVSFIKDNI